MCLYPQLIKNRKYTRNKKNGGNIPPVTDQRTRYVPIGCQKCIECKKQKAREWQVRLLEDIKTHTNGKFITLTFSNESYKELNEELNNKIKAMYDEYTPKKQEHNPYERDNAIATLGVRKFLERWRKTHKKSLRHWLVTELGHNGTENIHMHGIVWTNEPIEKVSTTWGYGYTWTGKEQNEKIINYVNERTVNYMIKYVSKMDTDHKHYNSKILTSPGIGHNYTNTYDSKKNKYNDDKTNETYRTRTGHKIAMPIYWRNKIYTEQERENLWIQKLDKQIRWVRGEKVDISKGEKEYYKLLKWHQEINEQLGYGNNIKDWQREKYEQQRKKLMQETRIKQAEIKEKINHKISPRRRGSKT